MANFSLAFPVSLVKDLDLVLEWNQRFWLTNPGEFVLEPIQEAFVELLVECLVISAGARSVSVEIEGVLDGLA